MKELLCDGHSTAFGLYFLLLYVLIESLILFSHLFKGKMFLRIKGNGHVTKENASHLPCINPLSMALTCGINSMNTTRVEYTPIGEHRKDGYKTQNLFYCISITVLFAVGAIVLML